MAGYFREEIECMDRDALYSMIDERVRYTVTYAAENSPFYRSWFRKNNIKVSSIRTHEDLLELPVINGGTIREHQPPETDGFEFLSTPGDNIFTIHETSGTSGVPKSVFLTWQDWMRYAEKYARIFVSQGFSGTDRVAVCASYGMNVGANTMTYAAHEIGFTVIPEGKCTFPLRVIECYRPTAIIGSVFKLLRLAARMKKEGMDPKESSIERLVVGGESFADESRQYLSRVWGVDVFNTYGSTEGTMCGECSAFSGLHIPEDLMHMDLYDRSKKEFVADGEEGRIVLTTLIPEGEICGTLLINYDTDDITRVISRDRCSCGRTHMRIDNPWRETENIYIQGAPLNRVDIEKAVFHPENMNDLTGEYEAFLYSGDEESSAVLRISVECENPKECDSGAVKERITETLLGVSPEIRDLYEDGTLHIIFHMAGQGKLELHTIRGRPKRLVDRR